MSLTPDWEAAGARPRFDLDGTPGLGPPVRASSPLLEVSNATVRLYKAAFGRGPTHARSRFAGPDMVVVLLQETLTVSERKLAALGEHGRLREHRLLLHQVVEPEIRAAVERILERTTVGLITGIDTHRDVAVEVITLAPVPLPVPGIEPPA